jgi:hypothetical protein
VKRMGWASADQLPSSPEEIAPACPKLLGRFIGGTPTGMWLYCAGAGSFPARRRNGPNYSLAGCWGRFSLRGRFSQRDDGCPRFVCNFRLRKKSRQELPN